MEEFEKESNIWNQIEEREANREMIGSTQH